MAEHEVTGEPLAQYPHRGTRAVQPAPGRACAGQRPARLRPDCLVIWAVPAPQPGAVPPARHFRAGPGYVIARSYEVWPRSHGDKLFMVRALIAVEGLRCELALRLPNLRSVAGEIRIEAASGHRLELPEDLLAVLGWDWARLHSKRDAWVSKLRLRGVALVRSARAELEAAGDVAVRDPALAAQVAAGALARAGRSAAGHERRVRWGRGVSSVPAWPRNGAPQESQFWDEP